MNFSRLARAVLGTAATWGVVWSVLSLPTLHALLNNPYLRWQDAWQNAVWPWLSVWTQAFGIGATLGSGFALLLLLAGPYVRRKGRLSVPLAAALGAGSAIGINLITVGPGIGVVGGLIVAALGATLATGTLIIARRAPVQVLDRVSGGDALLASE